MPANGKNGALTWILGLFTLFAVVNVLNALIQLNLHGNGAVTAFTIFDATLGSVNTETYLWASAIVMLSLFTAICFSIYRGLPLDPSLLQKIAKVEETLAANSNMIENTQIGFFKKLEDSEKLNDEAFHKINLNLEETRKEVADNLTKQKNALQSMEKETEKNTDNVKKQATDLSKIKKTLEQLENKNNEKPKVTGQTKLEDFKNVPPSLATRLNNIKITNVSELLAADSTSIAEKTGELPERIAHLQAQAQLLMVPGIDEKHSELLVKVGVTSRRELANQDPIQLYRGLVGMAKTYTEQGKMPPSKVPTIEDVSSWIKQACS
jgi:vacuolar-type H+-ATPase subunit I/STV1